MFVPTFQTCSLNGLEQNFQSKFKYIISKSKTKHVDDINFHYFTISFNGLLEHSNMNIRISSLT